MTRRRVSRLLTIYWIVLWSAVVFRVDRFPLTWVPMYSVYEPKDRFKIKLTDKKRIRRGFRVTHRDGSTTRVGMKKLNIPFGNMRRLYAQRAFGKGPPKFEQGNANLGRMNRWIRGLSQDELSFGPVEWDWRLFRSLNKTLGYEPSDPGFITRIEASYDRLYFTIPEVRLLRRKTKKSTLEWKEEWRERWE